MGANNKTVWERIAVAFWWCLAIATIALVIFTGSSTPSDEQEYKWEGGPYNINEFLIKFPDYRLEIDGCPIPYNISSYKKGFTTNRMGVVTLIKTTMVGEYTKYEKTVEKYDVYVKEEDKLYKLCRGLYLKYYKNKFSGETDHYFFYITPSFMMPENKEVVEKKVDEVVGETDTEVKEDPTTYTGDRKERHKIAEALRQEAHNLDDDIVTYSTVSGEDSKDRPMIRVGDIWQSESEKDREYNISWKNDFLSTVGCYDRKTMELAKKINGKPEFENKKSTKIQGTVTSNYEEPPNFKERKGGITMFGFSLWQMIGIIFIALVVAKTAHWFTMRMGVRFVKRRFLNFLERRKRIRERTKQLKTDIKKEWDEANV